MFAWSSQAVAHTLLLQQSLISLEYRIYQKCVQRRRKNTNNGKQTYNVKHMRNNIYIELASKTKK